MKREALRAKGGDFFSILLYHRIYPNMPWEYTLPQWNVPPEKFNKHLKYLKDNNFYVMGLNGLIARLQRSEPLSPKTVVITFDDGYKNIYLYAYPLLKKYGFQATIFVTTEYMGSTKPFGFCRWDRINSNRKDVPKDAWLPLSWEDCAEMARDGISIGSHSHTHRPVLELSNTDLYQEFKHSKELIEDHIGQECIMFSYPFGSEVFGDIDSRQIPILKVLGYKCALTTILGTNCPCDEPFKWKRLLINKMDGKFALEAKLSNHYNWVRRIEEFYKGQISPPYKERG